MLLPNQEHRQMSSSPEKQPDPLDRHVFISEADLARRWLHSVRSLQRWRAAGTALPHVRIGRRVVYRLVDVEAHEAGSPVR